jgi:thymidylate synthase
MKQYHELIQTVLKEGILQGNRTATAAYRMTGSMIKFDLRKGFPISTTKKVNLQTVATELVFFVRGLSDKKWLQDRKCPIWNEWCNPEKVPYGHDEETLKKMREETDLGRVYGVQWRDWNGGSEFITNPDGSFTYVDHVGIDQLKHVYNTLKTNPTDRRMIVMAWNPSELHKMALPPCHFGFMFTSDGEYLDLTFFMRSVDVFLGMPFNISSYALLLELMAKTVGMKARTLVGMFVDTHIYENHMEQVKLQLSREPYELPTLKLPDDANIFTWEPEQWELINYQHHAFIKAPVAV